MSARNICTPKHTLGSLSGKRSPKRVRDRQTHHFQILLPLSGAVDTDENRAHRWMAQWKLQRRSFEWHGVLSADFLETEGLSQDIARCRRLIKPRARAWISKGRVPGRGVAE